MAPDIDNQSGHESAQLAGGGDRPSLNGRPSRFDPILGALVRHENHGALPHNYCRIGALQGVNDQAVFDPFDVKTLLED
ncbi:MAG: hypothetical protein ACLPX8_21530 [Bryobacteraceae bacterium]